MEYIKVNLPETYEGYKNGYGEEVWALADEKVKTAYGTDEEGTTYKVLLDNDSWYYPTLMHGDEIVIEMRGDRRPVVSWLWLIEVCA